MALHNNLSKREQEVATLVLEGKTNKQIALALTISERTVEFHLRNIYDKFQVASRVELVLKLGSSTVAVQGGNAEDRPTPDERSWAALLREVVIKFGQEMRMETVLSANSRGAASPMSFVEAMRVCLVKYATFEGRASRPEFWWFALFVTLAASGLAYISQTAASVFLVAMLLPFLAAGARRLHDTGRSGWWQLFLLVPVAGFVVVGTVWALRPAGPLPDEARPAGES